MLAQGGIRNSGAYADLLSREPDFLEFCGGTSDPAKLAFDV
jgi:hypothetical protein